jgi:hypothetical protein
MRSKFRPRIAGFLPALAVLWLAAAAANPAAAKPRLIHLPKPHNAAGPALSPAQAGALLGANGLMVGTIRLLPNFGRVRVDGLHVETEGRWLVIKVLATKLP